MRVGPDVARGGAVAHNTRATRQPPVNTVSEQTGRGRIPPSAAATATTGTNAAATAADRPRRQAIAAGLSSVPGMRSTISEGTTTRLGDQHIFLEYNSVASTVVPIVHPIDV